MLGYFSYVPILLSILMINICCILSNAFSISIGIVIWFLSFILLIWYITSINLHMVNHSFVPEMNPNWLWCCILLMYCCIWLASILFRIFASILLRDIVILSFCVVLVRFHNQGNIGLIKWVRHYCIFNFSESLEG